MVFTMSCGKDYWREMDLIYKKKEKKRKRKNTYLFSPLAV